MNKNISKDLYIASLYFLYILLFYKVDITVENGIITDAKFIIKNINNYMFTW